MDKRGISPLIATILLIGFTVVLSILVVTWVSNVVEDQTEGTTTNVEAQNQCLDSIGDLSATFESTMGIYPYTIRIINDGNVNFDFIQVIWRITSSTNTETTTVNNLSQFSTGTSTTTLSHIYDSVILVPVVGEVECATVEINMPEFPFCGNGICNTGETYVSCPADCPPPAPVPGDGLCDLPGGEDCLTSGGDCVGQITSDCAPNACILMGTPQCNNPNWNCNGVFGLGLCSQYGDCASLPGNFVHDASGDSTCSGLEPCCIEVPSTCGNGYCDIIYGENCGNCVQDCVNNVPTCGADYICTNMDDWGIPDVPECLASCGSADGRCFDMQGCPSTMYTVVDPSGQAECDNHGQDYQCCRS